MYTSYIGQKFLEIYGQKTGQMISAQQFFDEIMYPLFFAEKRHLMHVSNSPFFQNPPEKELAASGLSKSEYQYEKLKVKIDQVSGEPMGAPDASIYVGFSANGPDQTTAGQVSEIRWKISANELYASWIGNALSVRVEGSQCLLIDSEPVLWHLFEGWQVYRDYMQPIQNMEGRQIETWNGYWLAKGDRTKAPAPPTKGSKLDTYPWLEVVSRLLEWHSGQVLPVYIFSLGQTNTTYGFINIHLPQLQRLRESKHALKHSLFYAANIDDTRFWELYIPEFSLRKVCEFGEMGLRAVQPKDFSKFINGEISPVKINEKNHQTFLNFEIWIMAMLNNRTELQELAAKLAADLVENEKSALEKSTRGKTSYLATSQAIFDAKGMTSFINGLTGLLDEFPGSATTCRQVVDQSIKIPTEQFPLFKALLRFEYTFKKKKN